MYGKFSTAASSLRERFCPTKKTPQPETPINEVIVLTQKQYEALEKALAPPAVTTATTELLAGFQLGVQEVLKKLRAGYVVGR